MAQSPKLAFERIVGLRAEDAVRLIASGYFDETLLALAGGEVSAAPERFDEVQPFSHERWLQRRAKAGKWSDG